MTGDLFAAARRWVLFQNWQRLHLHYGACHGIMTVFLQEQIQNQEVTEMFCNFDCASLLKMLCSFFGC